MPRGQLTKNEMKIILLTYKKELHQESVDYIHDPKGLAHKYLNRLLEKIEEYAR